MSHTAKNAPLKTYAFPFAACILRSPDGEPYRPDIESYLISLCDQLNIEIIQLNRVKCGYFIKMFGEANSYWGFKGKITINTTKENYKKFYTTFKHCDEDFDFVKYPRYNP